MSLNAPLPIAGPFTLGTVQLGTVYGLGAVQPSTVDGGAQANSRRRIGRRDRLARHGAGLWRIRKANRPLAWWAQAVFHIVTKIRSLAAVDDADAAAATKTSLAESFKSLGISSVDICLTHRPDDLLRMPVAQALRQAKASGSISQFGGSAYTREEAAALLQVEGIGALQIPMSVVNPEFRDGEFLAQARDRGVTVFVRSVFLQGALLMEHAQLPPHLEPLRPTITKLRVVADEAKVTLLTLLMGAVRGVTGVSSLVFGVDLVEHLRDFVSAAGTPALDQSFVDAAFKAGRGLPDAVTDPRLWLRRG